MSGAGAWAGAGARNPVKATPCQAVERDGVGKRVGGLPFSGPCPSRNALYPKVFGSLSCTSLSIVSLPVCHILYYVLGEGDLSDGFGVFDLSHQEVKQAVVFH